MAILAKLAKTLSLAAKGAEKAATVPGHVTGHFSSNGRTGLKFWVNEYQRHAPMVSRMPAASAATKRANQAVLAHRSAVTNAEVTAQRLGIKATKTESAAAVMKQKYASNQLSGFNREVAADAVGDMASKEAAALRAVRGRNTKIANTKAGIKRAAGDARRNQGLVTVEKATPHTGGTPIPPRPQTAAAKGPQKYTSTFTTYQKAASRHAKALEHAKMGLATPERLKETRDAARKAWAAHLAAKK